MFRVDTAEKVQGAHQGAEKGIHIGKPSAFRVDDKHTVGGNLFLLHADDEVQAAGQGFPAVNSSPFHEVFVGNGLLIGHGRGNEVSDQLGYDGKQVLIIEGGLGKIRLPDIDQGNEAAALQNRGDIHGVAFSKIPVEPDLSLLQRVGKQGLVRELDGAGDLVQNVPGSHLQAGIIRVGRKYGVDADCPVRQQVFHDGNGIGHDPAGLRGLELVYGIEYLPETVSGIQEVIPVLGLL